MDEITLSVKELESLLEIMKANESNEIIGKAKFQLEYNTDYKTMVLRKGNKVGYQYSGYGECDGIIIDL